MTSELFSNSSASRTVTMPSTGSLSRTLFRGLVSNIILDAVSCVPSVPDLHTYDRVPPVSDEPLGAGLEVRHARVLLYTRLVDHVVVDDDLAVAVRQILALLRRLGCILSCLALTAPSRALDVLAFDCRSRRQ